MQAGINSRRRRFNSKERVALFLAAGGVCLNCGDSLPKAWHGDHVVPWSRGGLTDVVNGQALCPRCNVEKGSATVHNLRVWQQEFLAEYFKE